MKKLAILLPLVLVLNGCSLFGLIDDKDSLEGVLSEQKSSDDYPGTHLLTAEDDEIFPLNSTILNLSSQQYLGNKVEVQVEYDEDAEVYVVKGVSVLEILEKEDGKANWTGYMNQELGFSWKYYDDWETYETASSAKFVAPFQGDYGENDPGILPQHDEVYVTMLESGGEDPDLGNYVVSEAKVGTNQQSALKHELSGSTAVFFIIDRSNGVPYEVGFFPGENYNNNNLNTFYEMLLEFQFVPIVEGGDEGDEIEDENLSKFEPEELEGDESDEPTEPEDPTDHEEPEDTAAEEKDTPKTPTLSEEAYDYSSYAEFESFPYHFSAKYPKSWYYSGVSGSEDGVLHKYAFSDESVTDENEFASLKVLSGDIPTGSSIVLPNGKAVKVSKGENVYFYVEVNDRVYSVQGPKEMEAILKNITASIVPVDTVE